MKQKTWSIYIVKCRDEKLYTGISSNVEQRIKRHNQGTGCRFTKYRHPVILIYQECHGTKSAARCRELEIQKLRRSEKLDLIKGIKV